MQIKQLLFILFTGVSFLLPAQQNTELEDLYNIQISPEERAKIKDKIFEFSQQISQDPGNYLHYYNRGVMYSRLGLHIDAISDYNKAIELKSDLSQAFYNRGLSRARFGYTRTSCVDIKKAADLGLIQGSTLYKSKCGLYFEELGELP
jgi:tetratricopeptide (TPR) repeat protein